LESKRDLRIDGRTRIFVIVGDPIAQVKAPGGLTAVLSLRGRNAVCIPIHVSSSGLGKFLEGANVASNIDGVIVTVPHKFACYDYCSSTTDRARFLGAVNAMRRLPAGGWFGEMLDGVGFVAGIRSQGYEPRGRQALVIGAGGAGSAIALALLEAGASALAIHDADWARRDTLIKRLRQNSDIPVVAGSHDPRRADIVVNATPMGMNDSDSLPVDAAKLTAEMFVGCVITAPAISPIVKAARLVGCRTSVGNDMYHAQQELLLEFLLNGAS
jgi:shikimate dehydrogenase